MTLTNTLATGGHLGQQPSAPLIILALSVLPDSSYPAGGWAFDPAALLQSLGNYDKAPTVLAVKAEPKGGYFPEFDRTNTKLKCLSVRPGGANLSYGGIAIGSVSKKEVLLANTVTYEIAGVVYQKTTAEHGFTATTDDIAASAAAVQEACYLLSVDAAGTVTITKGTTATGSGNAVVPACPSGEAPLGYVRIAVAAGATDFDATSDDLDAAHLTATYVNLSRSVGDADLAEVESGADLSSAPGAFRVLIFAQ